MRKVYSCNIAGTGWADFQHNEKYIKFVYICANSGKRGIDRFSKQLDFLQHQNIHLPWIINA